MYSVVLNVSVTVQLLELYLQVSLLTIFDEHVR